MFFVENTYPLRSPTPAPPVRVGILSQLMVGQAFAPTSPD
jgi:hypothetical protein